MLPEKRKQDFVFRRIRGRIVPIRVNSEVKEGTGLLAGGLAAAVATGAAASSLVKKSAALRAEAKVKFGIGARMLKRAKDAQMSFGFAGSSAGAAESIMRNAAKTRKLSATLFKSRGALLGAGLFGAGVLASTGLNKILKHQRLDSASEGAIETGVHTGITAAGFATYYGGFGAGLAGLGAALQRARGASIKTNFAIPIKSRFIHKGAKLRF